MRVIFTDLDGTLLDPRTYSWEDALPALEKLQQARIPVVFTTSKTRAEAEWWRREMGNHHPFIVENGGAIFIPSGYFGFPARAAMPEGLYEMVELGRPYPELIVALREAAAESCARVEGFHQWTAVEIGNRCGLPPQLAMLAKLRWYDEPFVILEGEAAGLGEAIRRRGKQCTRGGRFHHITGHHDKLAAVRVLAELYRQAYGELRTIGVGDHWNDVGFLNAMDAAVLMEPDEELRAAVPGAVAAPGAGAAAWARAVMQVAAG